MLRRAEGLAARLAGELCLPGLCRLLRGAAMGLRPHHRARGSRSWWC